MSGADNPNSFDWTTERIAELTRLWAEGLSGGEIGKRMGISKSSAVGKVHRLHLPSRPSPIKRAVTPKGPGSPRFQRAKQTDKPRANRNTLPALAPTVRVVRVPLESRRQEFAAMPVAKGKPCQFPLWGDEKPTHQYCGKNRLEGLPYCCDHASVCYIKAPPKAATPTYLSTSELKSRFVA